MNFNVPLDMGFEAVFLGINFAVVLHGLLFLAACWVLFACIKRIRMLPWRQHAPLVRMAYILIGLWALTYAVPIYELRHLGIVGIGLLFYSGRRRWMKEAPPETRSTP